MGRVPEEPIFDANVKLAVIKTKATQVASSWSSEEKQTKDDRLISAVSWPDGLDFGKLKSAKTGKEYNETCLQYMVDLSQAGLWLTDSGQTPMQLLAHSTNNGVTIRAEKAPVKGVRFPDLECVRHTAEFDVDAETLFDIYVRLTYTDAIDAYTYLVEMLEEIDVGDSKRFSWAHVERTADKIFPMFAHRDFVVLDFVDKENLMAVSRSCVHPARPQTPVPTCVHGLVGMCSKNPSRTLRSPLCYFQRVIPIGENKSRVVQFQYSDMGGVIPPAEQTRAVVQFGMDNMARFYDLVQKAKGLKVGPQAEDYLANPLLPEWRQDVADMIPGL